MNTKENNFLYFEQLAPGRVKWKKRNRYYHSLLERHYRFLVPERSKVLEIGCGTGDLLSAVSPATGVGVDFSPAMVAVASERYPEMKFHTMDAESLTLEEPFDYIILSDLLGSLYDIQQGFASLKKVTDRNSRVIISQYTFSGSLFCGSWSLPG